MEYKILEQQIHLLSQIIAKFNRTYVPQEADDSHTNLSFDPISNKIYGRWVVQENQKLNLALNLDAFQFELINNALVPLHSFKIQGKRIESIEQEIAAYLPEVGFSREGFTDKLHYEIPVYDFAEDKFEKWDSVFIKEWQENRAMANEACCLLLTHLQIEGETRIWPHHFDTGIYIEAHDNLGLGFGWAIEDGMVGDSYFYFTAYGLNGIEIDYSNVPKLNFGQWIINENWKGAVLSLNTIKDHPTSVNLFLKEVTSAALDLSVR